MSKQFHRSESFPQPTRRLIEMLDHVERRVELLREQAYSMENERQALLSTLAAIQSNKDLQYASESEKEEIELTTQHLMHRTLTVEVSVKTPRSTNQQKALDNVNKFLNDLLITAESDAEKSRKVLQQYINACLSECNGPVHQKFQSAILECTVDDQKRTKKRLESMLIAMPRNKH